MGPAVPLDLYRALLANTQKLPFSPTEQACRAFQKPMYILQDLHELRMFVRKRQPGSICNYITRVTQFKNVPRSKDVPVGALGAPAGFNCPEQPRNHYTIVGH